MNKILITGGAGFIGTNLVEELSKKDYEIRIIDLFPEDNEQKFEGMGIEIIKGGIRNKAEVSKAMTGVKFVVHLAAQTSVIDSIKNPELDFAINVTGTLNLLEAAKANNVEKFIFTSSAAVLGGLEPPLDEEQIPKPESPYGKNKLMAEKYCKEFNEKRLKTTVLRLSNVYGRYCENKTDVVSIFIRKILKNEPLTVFGDGSSTRDFVYVADVCRAIILCMEKEVGGELFHIGTGIETSINELIEKLESLISGSLKVNYKPARSGEIERSCFNIEKARDTLDYAPEVSLESGLKKTFEWLESREFSEETDI